MGRSRIFDQFARMVGLAQLADRRRVPTRVAAELRAEADARRLSRRGFVQGAAVAAAALGAGAALLPSRRAKGATHVGTRVAIIGSGLAGLACADTLAKWGIAATLYEAHPNRLGGRVLSDATTFPGQVAEVGGELIDNLHKTMLGYARELGLQLEDLGKAPGAPAFYFEGQHYSEEEVVDEYRVLVARMRPDLQAISGAPTFRAHTAADIALDNVDLATYLEERAGELKLIRGVLDAAYVSEYGLETSQQSTLNMLLFLHLDRSSRFREYGVFSDERYHVVGGNDAIIQGLADRIPGGRDGIQKGARLTRLARDAFGTYELYFNGQNEETNPDLADAVVCTVPFSVLRGVQLDENLGLSEDKLRAINTLGYGANAKTMVGFDQRVWAEQGYRGLAYSDLANVQNTWESNYSKAGPKGILTDYSGGARGAALQAKPPGTVGCRGCHDVVPELSDAGAGWIQQQAEAFLGDLKTIWPGAKDAASGEPGSRVVRRGHWLPQSYSRGSYTCYLPGQFTSIAGLEGESAGGLKFAGEHTDSFYEWQGFMEGACNSGIAAANEIVADIKAGRLPG